MTGGEAAKTNMAVLRRCAPRGQRLHPKMPYGHCRTLTFLAALRQDRIDAPCVLDQPINGQSFATWISQSLVPTPSPGDIIAMDNLSSHRRPVIRQAIRGRRRTPPLPSALLTQPQPDRANVRQAQAPAAQSRRAGKPASKQDTRSASNRNPLRR